MSEKQKVFLLWKDWHDEMENHSNLVSIFSRLEFAFQKKKILEDQLIETGEDLLYGAKYQVEVMEIEE